MNAKEITKEILADKETMKIINQFKKDPSLIKWVRFVNNEFID